ncbi:MAG: 2-octaprenyl-6-methoxyphenol hydroxylase, partial [Halothiobacillaceae bacterium]
MTHQPSSIALAYGSCRIFEALGLWQTLLPHAAPIKQIHISDRGHFGFAHLDSAAQRVAALGYVVEMRVLGEVLSQALTQVSNLDLMAPAKVKSVVVGEQSVAVEVERQGVLQRITAKLVVAADGDRSAVRDILQIPTTRSEYHQVAVIANVTPGKKHNDVAYERFTDSGPLALLPLPHNRCSLVWTTRPDQVDTLLQCDEAQFLAHLQERFGFRLGRFQKVGARHAYPLALVQAREHVAHRVVLIGNAAHTLHPVAGQGFNLGIRDVAALAQTLHDATLIGK